MIQADLFAAPAPRAMPAARRSDPETSRGAAMSARQLAEHHADIILQALRRHGASGKDRIAALTKLTGVQVARRCAELKRDGLIEETGRTVLSTSGRPEREWRAC